MADPFIGEIKIFAGNFAPRGYGFCNGQLVNISQNSALFAVLGTTFGGDGRVNFGLPNMQSRAPMHWGNGPGLTNRRIGETGGVNEVALTANQLGSHTHTLHASKFDGPLNDPSGNTLAQNSAGAQQYVTSPNVGMNAASTTSTGAATASPHDNRQPYLTLNFIIALTGVFPTRN